MTRLRERCRACGFTLIELLVTLVVVAILTVIAVPTMKHVLVSTNLANISNDLAGDLQLARTTAVSRRVDVAMTASAGSWQNGWTVTITPSSTATPPPTPEILRVHPAVPAQYVVTAGATTEVTFQPQGSIVVTAPAQPPCFTMYSPHASGNTPRFLMVTLPGSVQQQSHGSIVPGNCTAPTP